LFDNRPFQRASSQQTCARTYPRIEAISHVSALLIPTHYLVLGLTRRLFLHSQSSRFFCQLALHSLGLNPKIFRIQIFRIQMEQLLCAPLSSFFFRIQIWVQTHSTKRFGGRVTSRDFLKLCGMPRYTDRQEHGATSGRGAVLAEAARHPRRHGGNRAAGLYMPHLPRHHARASACVWQWSHVRPCSPGPLARQQRGQGAAAPETICALRGGAQPSTADAYRRLVS
jgi:hypothetical protein